jgi:hypothetical protein
MGQVTSRRRIRLISNQKCKADGHVEDLLRIATDSEVQPTNALWANYLDPPTACMLQPNQVGTQPRKAALKGINVYAT